MQRKRLLLTAMLFPLAASTALASEVWISETIAGAQAGLIASPGRGSYGSFVGCTGAQLFLAGHDPLPSVLCWELAPAGDGDACTRLTTQLRVVRPDGASTNPVDSGDAAVCADADGQDPNSDTAGAAACTSLPDGIRRCWTLSANAP